MPVVMVGYVKYNEQMNKIMQCVTKFIKICSDITE